MSDLIRLTPGMMLAVCYDVDVGPPGCECADDDPQLQLLAQEVSRCRIDALAWDGETLWILELKPYALPGAVGQVLTYRCLLSSDLPQSFQLSAAVVARAAHAATTKCARSFGIVVSLVSGSAVSIPSDPESL